MKLNSKMFNKIMKYKEVSDIKIDERTSAMNVKFQMALRLSTAALTIASGIYGVCWHLKDDVNLLKQDVNLLKQDVNLLKQDVNEIKEIIKRIENNQKKSWFSIF